VASGVSLLVLSLFLVPFIGSEFIPQADESQFNVIVRADPGWSLDATDQAVRDVEARVRSHPAVRYVFTTIGGGTQEKVNQAVVFAMLVDPGDRGQTQQEIMNQMRGELGTYATPAFRRAGGPHEQRRFPGGSASGQRSGPKTASIEKLRTVTQSLLDGLAKTPGIVDLDTTFESGKPQVSILIDRERAAISG